jgi:tripartite-type tricarboxylate transporter receptor subunit TctC
MFPIQRQGEEIAIMKRIVKLFVVMVALAALAAPAWSGGATEYPSRSINAVCGFPPGGPADVIGRGILPILQENIGQGIGMTNMPGAAGATAAAHVVSQPADGYTLYFGSEVMSVWQTMGTMDLSYKDFICVKLVSEAYPVLAVPPKSQFNSAAEFIDYAKAHPKELRIGTAGPGTVPHVSGLLLGQVLGCEFTFVPFQGGRPAVTAVMGGQVDATIEMIQSMVEAYKAGQLKILASFTNTVIPDTENIPALGKIKPELAPHLPYGPYFGLFAPKGTPDDVIKVLEKGMEVAVKDPRWIEYTKKMYLPRIDVSGRAAVKYLDEWTSRAAWLLYDSGGAKNSPADYGIPRP